MKFAIATIVAFLAATALSAPAEAEKRQFQAQLTFTGSTPADTYTVSAPTNAGSTFVIDHPNTSVTKISSLGGATCTIYGSQGSVTTIVGARSADVGPPQPQVSGSCLAF